MWNLFFHRYLIKEKIRKMKQTLSYLTTYFCLLLLGILNPNSLFAQPSNDECNTAINIEDLDNFCSSAAAFTNVDATPTQWQGDNTLSADGNDVWFQFTAIASNINLTIRGNGATGSLTRPEVELLSGTNCDGEFIILRSVPATNTSVVELNRGGLIPGVTYYFRVQGLNERTGTFQVCANNFFPPQSPGSDIEVASTLCNKSSFVIEQIEGAGEDNDEAAGTCLDGGFFGDPSEQSSTWFTWTAANDGTLEFVLDPINPTDDLDFVVYELPNGINNGTDKQSLRCMASSCEGPTGLSESSNDFGEDLGCEPEEDGFIKALDMREGVAYGLLINNFSESGNGFTITFGGTGEFQGPEPVIQASIEEELVDAATLCIGDSVSFDGRASAFGQGRITEYEWVFGTGATPETDSTSNPGVVIYSEPGIKTVTLTVTTADGCKVSTVREAIVTVDTCCLAVNIIADVTQIEQGETTELETNVMKAIGNVQYQWTPIDLVSCIDCPNPSITPDENTTVTVIITDENGCEATDSIVIEVEPLEIKEIAIPNAFTPNQDGFNDKFTILGGAPDDRITSLQVFTRWGNMVFEANNIPLGDEDLGWDGIYKGKRLQPDVFIYRAVVALADGEVRDFTGDIMLIR